jgi:hypothetical protein
MVSEGVGSFCLPWLDKLSWIKWRDTQIECGYNNVTANQFCGAYTGTIS